MNVVCRMACELLQVGTQDLGGKVGVGCIDIRHPEAEVVERRNVHLQTRTCQTFSTELVAQFAAQGRNRAI